MSQHIRFGTYIMRRLARAFASRIQKVYAYIDVYGRTESEHGDY